MIPTAPLRTWSLRQPARRLATVSLELMRRRRERLRTKIDETARQLAALRRREAEMFDEEEEARRRAGESLEDVLERSLKT